MKPNATTIAAQPRPARTVARRTPSRPKLLRGKLVERCTPEEIRAYARVHFALMESLGPDAKSGERSLAAAVLAYEGRFWGGEAYPAIATLGDLAGLKVRAAEGHLTTLIKKGTVSIRPEPGLSHVYTAHFPEKPSNPTCAESAGPANGAPDQSASLGDAPSSRDPGSARAAADEARSVDNSPFAPVENPAPPGAAADDLSVDGAGEGGGQPFADDARTAPVLRFKRVRKKPGAAPQALPALTLPPKLARGVLSRGWALTAVLRRPDAHEDPEVTHQAVADLLKRDPRTIDNPAGLLTLKIRDLLTAKAEAPHVQLARQRLDFDLNQPPVDELETLPLDPPTPWRAEQVMFVRPKIADEVPQLDELLGSVGIERSRRPDAGTVVRPAAREAPKMSEGRRLHDLLHLVKLRPDHSQVATWIAEIRELETRGVVPESDENSP